MNNTEATKLMYAVLDGGASPEERSALERALAADPQLREEFDGLRRMFAELDAMPRYAPPPGFAERVVALQRSMAVGDPAHQLFSRSGVIGSSGKDSSVRNPSVNATRPRTPSESIWGNWQMAMSKRGMWIVGGVAAAVAAMFIGGVVDFPASGDKATGTIAPAKKAKGEQPGTDDLKRRAVDQDDNLRRGKSEPGPGGATPVAGAGGGAGGASGGDVGSAAGGGGRGGSSGGDVGSAAGGGGRGGSSGGDVGSAAGGGGRGATAGGDVGSAAGGGSRAGGSASAVGSAAGSAVGAADAKAKK